LGFGLGAPISPSLDLDLNRYTLINYHLSQRLSRIRQEPNKYKGCIIASLMLYSEKKRGKK